MDEDIPMEPHDTIVVPSLALKVYEQYKIEQKFMMTGEGKSLASSARYEPFESPVERPLQQTTE